LALFARRGLPGFDVVAEVLGEVTAGATGLGARIAHRPNSPSRPRVSNRARTSTRHRSASIAATVHVLVARVTNAGMPLA
jgi:hypothetical protein